MDQPMGQLSGGQQETVALANVPSPNRTFLILDDLQPPRSGR